MGLRKPSPLRGHFVGLFSAIVLMERDSSGIDLDGWTPLVC